MDQKPNKPLRVFVNPFSLWTKLALHTGKAILESAEAAAKSTPRKVVALAPQEPPAPAKEIPTPLKAKKTVRAKTKSRPAPKSGARTRRAARAGRRK